MLSGFWTSPLANRHEVDVVRADRTGEGLSSMAVDGLVPIGDVRCMELGCKESEVAHERLFGTTGLRETEDGLDPDVPLFGPTCKEGGCIWFGLPE
ncbi:unnamed protein product [Echinostoma caproni]|uniref:Uncharacterized protein n=1 Tax=Echinostoma caproni TaxID=27848 RepID=A0A183AHR3_9TREM|nr:unnamed protein product [Echinostoma caproni]